MVLYIYRYIQYICIVFPGFITHTAWPCLHYNSRICIVFLCLCTSGHHFSLHLLHPSLGHLSFWIYGLFFQRHRGKQGRCYVHYAIPILFMYCITFILFTLVYELCLLLWQLFINPSIYIWYIHDVNTQLILQIITFVFQFFNNWLSSSFNSFYNQVTDP